MNANEREPQMNTDGHGCKTTKHTKDTKRDLTTKNAKSTENQPRMNTDRHGLLQKGAEGHRGIRGSQRAGRLIAVPNVMKVPSKKPAERLRTPRQGIEGHVNRCQSVAGENFHFAEFSGWSDAEDVKEREQCEGPVETVQVAVSGLFGLLGLQLLGGGFVHGGRITPETTKHTKNTKGI
jgi:hypothetical protein